MGCVWSAPAWTCFRWVECWTHHHHDRSLLTFGFPTGWTYVGAFLIPGYAPELIALGVIVILYGLFLGLVSFISVPGGFVEIRGWTRAIVPPFLDLDAHRNRPSTLLNLLRMEFI